MFLLNCMSYDITRLRLSKSQINSRQLALLILTTGSKCYFFKRHDGNKKYPVLEPVVSFFTILSQRGD